MKKSIQDILGIQMPTDTSKPVVISVETVKDCDFNTMPEGMRLQVERQNDILQISRSGAELKIKILAELDGDPEGVCEFAFESVANRYSEDSADDAGAAPPILDTFSTVEDGLVGVQAAADTAIEHVLSETKIILTMAMEGVSLHRPRSK